ncbi:carbohydrate ABC transporter permease [Bacillus shivajii]|uniref:carbohydrate ABC transporter permease n=1 Tax=Bacillus shivajii TaxID=1983719 RepID=UPI001CFB1B33|nr:carbohydrate ABC transporter permease [Bacillus shivajii]UCZ55399.1 carbohydrate ABC transporter permease [Bacillus shivajii]
MIIPFLWMISTSLKTYSESMQVPPTIIPESFQFSNFAEVFEKVNFLTYYWNTILMTLGRTIGQLFFCSLTAFAFARMNFKGKNILFVLILSVLMVPSQIVMIPSFVVMREFGWIDTFWALITPGIFSAFGVFLLRQFFMSIPRELDEAAKIDGCSFFGIYWRIILPLSRPAMIALAIFAIMSTWNDFMWPLIVTNSDDMRVLSIGIASFQGQYNTQYPLLMSGALMATAPMIVVFMFLQKYFIQGIALTGSKG